MKVCVSSTGPDLDSQVDPRFGRCAVFIIADTETMDWEAMENVAAGAMGGAGIQAAQNVAAKGVVAVITGNVGPNAFATLSTAGVKIFTGATGTVKQAINAFKSGSLNATDQATSAQHSGMGGGPGSGMGGAGGGGGRRGGMPGGGMPGGGMPGGGMPGGGMPGGGSGRLGFGMGMGQGLGPGYTNPWFYPTSEKDEIDYLVNYENMLKYQIKQIQDRINQLKHGEDTE